MKKISLTILALTAAVGASYGQGYVAWSATPATAIIGETNTAVISPFTTSGTQAGTNGLTVGSGSSLFTYALFINTSSSAVALPTTISSLTPSWTFTGLEMNNGTTANGRLATIPGNGGSAVNVDSSYTSGTVNFLIVGFSSNIGGTGGTNIATALYDVNNWSTVGQSITGNAFFGISTEGTLSISTSSAAGTTIWGGSGISNPLATPLYLDVLPTPEPGTMALAAIGGASLLLFRRRK